MIISSLNLTNFRNFPKKSLIFHNGVTVLIGPNTIGKTSILEAMFYLVTGKSFRAEKDFEVVRWGEEIGRISAKCKVPASTAKRDEQSAKLNEQENLEIIFTGQSPSSIDEHRIMVPQRKQFLVNGVEKRMVDFAGYCKAVLFRPEDLELITDSPSLRRRYLDFVLIQVDREYRRAIISYERGLRQRNRLLEAIRDKGISRSQLIFWDQLLIKNGNFISDKRREYLDYINSAKTVQSRPQQNLSPKKNLGDFSIFYDDSQISVGRLVQYAEEEVAAGVTLVGPHRDDMKFQTTSTKYQINSNFQIPDNKKILNKTEMRDLSVYGSRGEQRLAVLWLKLKELEFIEKMTSERPILLLDDIFSELDHPHRKLVMEIVGKQQTIITTADKHYIESGKEMEIVEL